ALRPSNTAFPHAAPADRERPASLGKRSTRTVLALGTLFVAGSIGAAVFGLAERGSPAKLEDAVAAIDALEGRVVGYAPVGTTPRNVAVGEGAVWVLNADDETLSRIDPETRQIVKTVGTGGTPTELAVGGGAVWVGSRGAGARPSFGNSTTSILRIDPVSAVVTRRLVLPRPRSKTLLSNTILGVSQLAVGAGAVWAINPDLTVSRIDPGTGDLVATITDTTVSASSGIAAGKEGVWVISEGASVTRIDPQTNRTGQKIALGSTPFLVGIAVGAGSVWVSVPEDGVVWRIEPGLQPRTRTIQVGFGVTNIAFAEGALWATNFIDGTVSRIDPEKNAVTRTVRVSGTPQGVAVGDDTVWVSVAGATTRGALPASACGEIESGGKTPAVLIASDLPLQGLAAPATRSMADAIRFVLRKHDFTAGRFAVGYQSCDNSTARSGTFDFFKCASNARAYAQANRLVAAIGPYDSDCAQVELIVANQVSGGELAMIGPSTTYSGLTRGGTGAWASRDDPKRYYPSGARTFLRLPTPDDLQVAGAALLARSLALESIYVLDGGGAWGLAARRSFVAAARRLGLEIAGIGSWDVRAQSYAPLAARVKRSGAQGVFLSGSVFFNGGQVVNALRAGVGRDVVLIGGEGFGPISELLRTAGSSALGMYVVVGSTPLEKLGPAGRQFASAFGSTQPHGMIPTFVLEAAQATELLLQALERSDGTRASVLRELRASRVKGGVLGSFRFDRNGDVTPTTVAVYRITGKVRRDAKLLSGFEGAIVEHVLKVPESLRG
ncbi:MAG: ABC transporter substrate-binding protein, partial [Gaiellaceae bacterium]